MKVIAISAKVPAKKDVPGSKELTATINVNYPDLDGDINAALTEAVNAFGAKAILSNAFANWRVTLQAGIRKGLEDGQTQEALQTKYGSAKMGVATVGAAVDAEQAFTQKFLAATPEERTKMIANLKAKAAAAGTQQ